MQMSSLHWIGLNDLVLAALDGTNSALAASPADWSRVRMHRDKLFYPEQGGYAWLRSADHKRAYKKVIAGNSCVSCHEGEEEDIGQLLLPANAVRRAVTVMGGAHALTQMPYPAHDPCGDWRPALDPDGGQRGSIFLVRRLLFDPLPRHDHDGRRGDQGERALDNCDRRASPLQCLSRFRKIDRGHVGPCCRNR